jgi:hypothetical protein
VRVEITLLNVKTKGGLSRNTWRTRDKRRRNHFGNGELVTGSGEPRHGKQLFRPDAMRERDAAFERKTTTIAMKTC